MSDVSRATSGGLTVVGYRGDAKTMLAFDLGAPQAANLAGFTVHVAPPGIAPYYLLNMLRFEHPEAHAQVDGESPNSSANAPFHKFRWLHVPGTAHQGITPVFGTYRYTVTPRYFDVRGSMQPLDPSAGLSIEVEVGPFGDGAAQVGFTRGYIQSQAFVRHFGPDAVLRPHSNELLFDTSQQAGSTAAGPFSYADEYVWCGATARQLVFAVLDEVRDNPALTLDMFAYDLNEPDVLNILLELARQGRVRIILDNAALHHSTSKPTPEDTFEGLFAQAAKAPAQMKRGKFGRYAHDKILIVRDATGAQKVLTGSTNFSVTGLYVNANHVLVFPAGAVASEYALMFQTVWDADVSRAAYLKTSLATETFAATAPPMTITFAPHPDDFTTTLLGGIVARVQREGGDPAAAGSVLFAVMDISGSNPVYDVLNAVHENDNTFSMGISDSPDGISLYTPGTKTGVLVTGKPAGVRLPPPFNQVPGIGAGHEIHHKFVVCGFPGNDPVVYCGSSNLAQGGEEQNGDNLLEIHDPGIVTAFAIEALTLVDHYQFLDRLATASGADPAHRSPPPAVKQQAAAAAGWFLSTTDAWSKPYFDQNDLHCRDRELFA